jgi:hypothetical protein
MPYSWKIGLIKIISKVVSPTSFGQWRPISLMGGLYKIFTEVIANQLHKVLPSIVHPMHYGLIVGRDILHKILNVQMVVNYAKESKQEIVMIQLEKAYDHVSQSFHVQLMSEVGFGTRISRLTFMLGLGAVSRCRVVPRVRVDRAGPRGSWTEEYEGSEGSTCRRGRAVVGGQARLLQAIGSPRVSVDRMETHRSYGVTVNTRKLAENTDPTKFRATRIHRKFARTSELTETQITRFSRKRSLYL